MNAAVRHLLYVAGFLLSAAFGGAFVLALWWWLTPAPVKAANPAPGKAGATARVEKVEPASVTIPSGLPDRPEIAGLMEWYYDPVGGRMTGPRQHQRAIDHLPQQITVWNRTIDVVTTRRNIFLELERLAGDPIPIPGMPTDLTSRELLRDRDNREVQENPAQAAAWLLGRLRVADFALAVHANHSIDDILTANAGLCGYATVVLNRPDVALEIVHAYLFPYCQKSTLKSYEQGSTFKSLWTAQALYRLNKRTKDDIWALQILLELVDPSSDPDQWRFKLAEAYIIQKDYTSAAAQLRAITQPHRFPLTAQIPALEKKAATFKVPTENYDVLQ